MELFIEQSAFLFNINKYGRLNYKILYKFGKKITAKENKCLEKEQLDNFSEPR